MELYCMYIIDFMLQCHDHSIVIYCRNFQFFRKAFGVDSPAMISPNFKSGINIFEQFRIFFDQLSGSGYSMKNFGKIDQASPKSFSDSLLSQAYSKNTFCRSVFPDKIQ